MLRFRPIFASRHFIPLGSLLLLDTLLFSRVLFGGQALLPGAMLRGFAPFINGSPPSWDILRWDALGQYYPWRFFGAQQLRQGLIPLWNPHQFAGTPFVANGQSAIFYPLNLPFWIFNVAWAFGFSAWMHTLLAACGTYFLTQNWKWSRAASLFSAIGYAFGGYLTAWTALPTLFQTAAWLPLLLLLLEHASNKKHSASLSATLPITTAKSVGATATSAVSDGEECRHDGESRRSESGKRRHESAKRRRKSADSFRESDNRSGQGRFSLSQEREALSQEREALSQEREALSQEQEPLSQEREALSQERQPLSQERQPLSRGRQPLSQGRQPLSRLQLSRAALPLALSCALLAGHAQIFFYCLVALALRALFLNLRAWRALASAVVWCLALGAAQILPTLELSRLGHRVGGPTVGGWRFLHDNALQPGEWMAAFIPNWPMHGGSFNENFSYVGAGVLLMALIGFGWAIWVVFKRDAQRPLLFCVALTVFGLLYALATPLSQAFYFHVPGLSQMGGVGRALVLWNLGAALLAGAGLDALRRRIKTPILPAVALAMVCLELFSMSWSTQLFAPRQEIYPQTALTTWLQDHTRDGSRILFLTRSETWLPSEPLLTGRATHPIGVLPPNGATVYGLNDINGYDSLSLLKYREFVAQVQPQGISPQTNGNMVLLSLHGTSQTPQEGIVMNGKMNLLPSTSRILDALNVRYVVADDLWNPDGPFVLYSGLTQIFERQIKNVPRKSGKDFAPGWRDGKYQPQSFRLGLFIALCAVSLGTAILRARRRA